MCVCVCVCVYIYIYINNLTTKIFHSIRIKNLCRPITNPLGAKRITISRKKGINNTEPENEETL